MPTLRRPAGSCLWPSSLSCGREACGTRRSRFAEQRRGMWGTAWVWAGGCGKMLQSARFGSVPRAGLDLLALGGVGAALLLQRCAGLGDVVGEAVDVLSAESLLGQSSHDFYLLGVGRHGVGGDHPAALGGELPGDVELIVVLPGNQLERDQRQLLHVGSDQLEIAALLEVAGESA